MKFILSVVLLVSVGAACTKEQTPSKVNSGIEGNWKLIEQLNDPGDGSGTFQATNDNKVITFDANGNFTCTATTCMTGIGSGPSSGTYNLTNLTLSPDSCSAAGFDIRFEIYGDTMIISYPCFEACKEKFIKL
jgi:hypothetical protein